MARSILLGNPITVLSKFDEIEVKNSPASRQLGTRCLEESRARNVPGWLTMNAETFKATVVRLPTRDEMEQNINEQLIVEFYSRF